MKKNYIISGTAVATILAIITLLRDVFEFKLAFSDVARWFQNPILYLYGGLIISLFCMGILIGFNLSRQVQDSEIKVFDLSNNLEAELFYKELYRSYQSASSEIYLTGTGFVSWSESQQKLIDNILSVTEEALKRGVTFIRIQKSDRPAEEWAERFAKIMQNHSEKLKVYADFKNIELANTALIDPIGKYPIVQILFETEEVGINAKKLEASVALFIYGRRDLAKNLQARFLSRIKYLDRLLPSEMRDLGLGIYYFAYSSNISSSQMKKRCPTAKKIGVGILYDWELDFAVDAPHLKGNVSGIYGVPNKYVWGVVYAISKNDKEELDKIEQGGYYPLEVSIKMQNSQQHLNEVVAYIPSKPKSPSNTKPDPHYIEVVLEGAREHGLKELVDYLENIKQGI